MTAYDGHNKELNLVFDSFYKSVKHAYLDKFIKDPVIDKDQANMLLIILQKKKCSKKYIHDCILTTLFVQAALDTHERVVIHGLGPESIKTKNQLTVLAGDFYSSLYYNVLSKNEDVALIRVLAKAIQQINESKMKMYHLEDKKGGLNLADIKVIYASLLKNISHLFHLSQWSNIIEEFFLLKFLCNERASIIEYGYRSKESILGDVSVTFSKKQLLEQLTHLIHVTRERIEDELREENEMTCYVKVRMYELIERYRIEKHCVVEEG
ncbi:heptaprenyl diphosphate synthase component 1 [Salipaludibacillus sp. LMS25]|jgi:heptaprenyl diphosphate synthase|uniref:heptaprenyl diphosphate synthase component 1 n=1 Tax=Salipaludibacillus sp. LMS25 TaxID=2924031 RepID=UPI0020D0FEEE|nr:heptaprenyl diphosphate synthase component 1 [Salipaludibacillus sp. LMS25]UTR14628.1 heptaprenyl diphosphate synthase component 1 [Salipaludibacillus sp. LMS25]